MYVHRYNEPLDAGGAYEGGADHKEWELFDCEEDPLELCNVYHDKKYAVSVSEKNLATLIDGAIEPDRYQHL